MIEKMKSVCIVTTIANKDQLLNSLRDLGIMHLSEKKSADPLFSERYAELLTQSSVLNEYKTDGQEFEPLLSDAAFSELEKKVASAIRTKAEMEGKMTSCRLEAEKIAAWGRFDPAEVRKLSEDGVAFRFYSIDKKELEKLKANEAIRFIRLSPVDKRETIAVLDELPSSVSANEFSLPKRGLSELEQELNVCESSIRDCENALKDASRCLNSYSDQLLTARNAEAYSQASQTAENDDALVWLSGYIPESETENFTKNMDTAICAWSMDDISEDDEAVPTKVKYTKLTRLIEPVFNILGTVPGYREYDISFWFLGFFALFTAMIIGDAGYGVIFLIIAVVLTFKIKLSNVTLLVYVLSIATILWGAVTGTWFGLEGAMKIPFLKALVIPSIANYPEYFNITASEAQNNVMKFCFSIGTMHLTLACILSIIKKFPKKDLSWIADLGWCLSVCALYFLVLFLVIGQQTNTIAIALAVGCGFLLVVLFGGMSPNKTFAQGLKSGLADTFTVFLNTISAFGNVMSYIRLFAVGMASLAIAQSFNNMASGFSGVLVIAGAAIMIIGHVLNIVMGILSVVVHGVRLNLLEFSGQLGMEWSGTAYDPFRKLKK